jgi:hypothetical protein
MHPDRPSPTITTKCHSISNGRFGHYDETQLRGISLREAAILQSFPDAYHVVILSMRGLSKATFARESRIGPFTLSRPTGEYDLLGNQLFENGQLRFDTVYRFKGQQAPAIILTDVELNHSRLDHYERLLFTAMTRATVRLEIVMREGSSLADRLMHV